MSDIAIHYERKQVVVTAEEFSDDMLDDLSAEIQQILRKFETYLHFKNEERII